MTYLGEIIRNYTIIIIPASAQTAMIMGKITKR